MEIQSDKVFFTQTIQTIKLPDKIYSTDYFIQFPMKTANNHSVLQF